MSVRGIDALVAEAIRSVKSQGGSDAAAEVVGAIIRFQNVEVITPPDVTAVATSALSVLSRLTGRLARDGFLLQVLPVQLDNDISDKVRAMAKGQLQ